MTRTTRVFTQSKHVDRIYDGSPMARARAQTPPKHARKSRHTSHENACLDAVAKPDAVTKTAVPCTHEAIDWQEKLLNIDPRAHPEGAITSHSGSAKKHLSRDVYKTTPSWHLFVEAAAAAAAGTYRSDGWTKTGWGHPPPLASNCGSPCRKVLVVVPVRKGPPAVLSGRGLSTSGSRCRNASKPAEKQTRSPRQNGGCQHICEKRTRKTYL